MLTADRTTIRRRLTVGRAANRPPWRLGKPRHRPIVPPLGATLAATVALGVGIALARAGRERLTAWRAQPPELALQGDEPLDQGLKRMALEQLDVAIGQLGGFDGRAPDENAVHETRKALKRLRALLRMLDAAVGKKTFTRENAQLRDVAKRLSAARDAEVMLATLDGLIEHNGRKLSTTAGVQKLRGQLEREHQLARAQALGDTKTLAHVLGELRVCRVRVEGWQLPPGDGFGLAAPGFERLYDQGRKRYRRAAAGKGEPVLTMHEWRTRVKDLRYVAEMLQQREPTLASALPSAVSKPARKRRDRARASTKLLRDVARHADTLGEVLGEDHDLAVLAQVAQRKRERHGAHLKMGRRGRKRLLRVIERRRRKLRRRALREGQRLYQASPKTLLRRVRR